MKTKQRGLRRKCAAMVQRISQETEVFPKPHPGCGFWHLHLSLSPSQVELADAYFGVQKLCVQTLLDRAHHLATIAPKGQATTRVIVAINLPKLTRSQIIVFFGDEYFGIFFNRDSPTQKWTALAEKRSLTQEWGLQIPPGFLERGVHEETFEPDFLESSEIWFIGQLKAFDT